MPNLNPYRNWIGILDNKQCALGYQPSPPPKKKHHPPSFLPSPFLTLILAICQSPLILGNSPPLLY